MTGGTWISQNKVRPGAYINFRSIPAPLMTVGDRGIGLIPLSLNWGAEGELIEVLSEEMNSGLSIPLIGFDAFSAESKVLRLMLQNCYKALVYRTNTGGEKASVVIEGDDDNDLTVTAKHTGTLGNDIVISVVDVEGVGYDVKTYVNARLKNTQTITDYGQLVSNDFVVFSGIGTPEEVAGEPLSGGTNGTDSQPSVWFSDFLALASLARWQTMAVPHEDPLIAKQVLVFITDQIEGQGRSVQAVVPNSAADYDGIINNQMGVVMDGETITRQEFTAYVAGITAGATVIQSNTAKVVTGATKIIGERDNERLIQSLRRGEFVLSMTQRGMVKVEQDINSFISVTQGKNYAFSKNRINRVMAEIRSTVGDTWESSYMGKVGNNEGGRASFQGDLIAYLNELQRIGAIQEFLGAEHVIISQGERLDAVLAVLQVKPVDSMEYLYMTVNLKTT